MDFVEVMEVQDGLILAHRVYWGWRGVDVLINDQYHRDRTEHVAAGAGSVAGT